MGGGGPTRDRDRQVQAQPVLNTADNTKFWGSPCTTKGSTPCQPLRLSPKKGEQSRPPPVTQRPPPLCLRHKSYLCLRCCGFPLWRSQATSNHHPLDLFFDRRRCGPPHVTGETTEAQGAGSSEISGSQDSGLGLPPPRPSRRPALRRRRQSQPVPAR